MKNLAIIMGVTNYMRSDLELPACAYDVEIMQTILRTSGQFEVHTIESADSELMKNELAGVIKRHSQEEIGQLFFYFTGHGVYQHEDFLFLLRDYDESRPAQTSLSSKELDNQLRSLHPSLAIKVIDACQSGVSYIKSGLTLNVEDSDHMKSQFGNCYFMFSSDGNQSSYASEYVSDFTLQFAKSIVHASSDEIRYRHIAEYISDELAIQKRQTPFFVSQGPLTESLGSFNAESKTLIKSLLPAPVENTEIQTNSTAQSDSLDDHSLHDSQPPTLLELAQKRALHFVSQAEAIRIVAEMKVQLQSWVINDELSDLYDVDFSFEDSYHRLPNAKSLGTWVDNQGYGYFASPSYNTEYYEVEPASFSIGYTMDHFMPRRRSREVISGIQTSLNEMPFLSFHVTLKPKILGLSRFTGWVTYVISRQEMQVFYNFIHNKEVAWENFETAFSSNWQRIQFSLTAPPLAIEFPVQFYREFYEWVHGRVSAALRR